MLYIVMNIEWEYDDNFYTQRSGGAPVIGYRDEKLAKIDCNQRNLEYFNKHYNLNEKTRTPWQSSIREYLEYYEPVDLNNEDQDFLNEIQFNIENCELSRQLNEEEVIKLLDILGIHWYSVVEIPDVISDKVYKKIAK